MTDNFIPFNYEEDFEDVKFGADGEIYGKARKKKKFSKNDMIYGVWN